MLVVYVLVPVPPPKGRQPRTWLHTDARGGGGGVAVKRALSHARLLVLACSLGAMAWLVWPVKAQAAACCPPPRPSRAHPLTPGTTATDCACQRTAA